MADSPLKDLLKNIAMNSMSKTLDTIPHGSSPYGAGKKFNNEIQEGWLHDNIDINKLRRMSHDPTEALNKLPENFIKSMPSSMGDAMLGMLSQKLLGGNLQAETHPGYVGLRFSKQLK